MNTVESSPSIHDRLLAIVPPVSCFLMAEAVIVLAAIHAGRGLPGAGDLSRGDSHNYLSIARHGYLVIRCSTHCPPGLPPGWWGNAAWFPLYPLLIAPFIHIGLPAAETGAVLSAVFALATLLLLWLGFLRRRTGLPALIALATAAVFPGAVYYYGVFPLSLLTFLTVGAMLAARREAWLPAAFLAALASATYELGVLVPVVLSLWALLASGGTARRRVNRALWVSAAAFAALVAIVVSQKLMTGHWDAFFKIQSHFGHGLHDPLPPLRRAETETLSFLHQPSRTDLVPSVQLIFVGVLVSGALIAGLRRGVEERFVCLLVVMTWAMPLVIGGTLSYYRSNAALLAAVLLTLKLPRAIQLGFLLIALPLAFLLATLYFRHQLV